MSEKSNVPGGITEQEYIKYCNEFQENMDKWMRDDKTMPPNLVLSIALICVIFVIVVKEL